MVNIQPAPTTSARNAATVSGQIAISPFTVAAYTEGLDEGCGDAVLNSALLSNRAAVNVQLGNWRRVITDCTAAVEANGKNVKAHWRALPERSHSIIVTLQRRPAALVLARMHAWVAPANSS